MDGWLFLLLSEYLSIDIDTDVYICDLIGFLCVCISVYHMHRYLISCI